MSGLDKEVEARMSRLKSLDIFTDEFSPPGISDTLPGGNYNKRDAPYEKPHDDYVPEAESHFWDKSKLHSSGDPKDQAPMDDLDETEYRHEAPVKKIGDQFPGIPKVVSNPYDVFPGDVDMNDHREETRFDPHLTDPARLKKMKDLSGPEAFHKEVEKRMKHLAIKDHPKAEKIVSEYQKNPQYNPDDSDKESAGWVYNLSKGDSTREESMMKHGMDVDEELWSKAKQACLQGYGKLKWPIVKYLYSQFGGK